MTQEKALQEKAKELLQVYLVDRYEYFKQITAYTDDEEVLTTLADMVDQLYQQHHLPKKGVITKEVWDVPMPSAKKYMQNKKLDYQFLGAVMLQSNYGGKVNNSMKERFIYKNKLYSIKDGEKIPTIASELGISRATFFKKVKRLIDVDMGLVEVGHNEDGEIFYKINYATDNKHYVTIPSDILEYLVKCTNSNILKFYILFLYNLTEPIFNELGDFVGTKRIRKQMTYEYLVLNCGLSPSRSRKDIHMWIDLLVSVGLLNAYEIEKPIRKPNLQTGMEEVLTVKGYEYELTTYEEWLNTRPIYRKKQNKNTKTK